MQISNNFSVSGLEAARNTNRTDSATNSKDAAANINSSAISQPVDKLDLSAEALAGPVDSSSGVIRADKVADIRQQIASGTYDTDAKLEMALGRMLDSLG